MMETNKQFDEKLLNGSFNSHADANKILTIESIKKHKAHVTRQFRPRSMFVSDSHCLCNWQRCSSPSSTQVLIFGGN